MAETNHTSTYRPPRTEEQREARRAYQRKYRAEHPDKVRAWQRRFYIRQAQKLAAEAEEVTVGAD